MKHNELRYISMSSGNICSIALASVNKLGLWLINHPNRIKLIAKAKSEAVNVKITFKASALEFDEQRLNKRKHELNLDRQFNKALDCGVQEVYKDMSLYPKALSEIPHIKTTLVKRLPEEYREIVGSRIHIVLARAMELNPPNEEIALELIENSIA